MSKRHYKQRKHWHRLWQIKPERMYQALKENRAKRDQYYSSVVEGWKVDLVKLPFPMSSKDFNRLVKVWVKESIKGRTRRGYQPKSLKAYFLRHKLLTFDGVKRQWNLSTCVVDTSNSFVLPDCPKTLTNDSAPLGESGGNLSNPPSEIA